MGIDALFLSAFALRRVALLQRTIGRWRPCFFAVATAMS
jgi:hypothetical protein